MTPPALALSAVLLASLAACGGGSSPDQSATPADATGAVSSSIGDISDATATALATTEALPAYHLAPALLDEPGQDDVGGTNLSARTSPRRFEVDAAVATIETARLSHEALAQRLADAGKARIASASDAGTAPLATAIVGTVFTPAQIRAAYGLPALPATGVAITPAIAATLGAGQTIYLIDAYHDANALHDLNTFSARFGLPTCTNVAIATTAALPLAKPPSSCTFSAVYSSTRGTMTATVPAYNATWAPESKLDVQWAHAIAPLARIVLIEMPSAMSNNILDGNTLAGKLGAGVVSMSFGSAEAAWASTTDYAFKAAGVTYVAAAGDSGSQVLWPAVSPNVVAVGGTSTNWSGTGTRYDAAWLHTGGGMSAYEALPAWQSGVTPAGGTPLVRRAVPDVAFNANPMTGEYVALTPPGSTTTTWSAYGGTSIAAPQWAGVIAVANAMRVANAKPTLGDIHTLLYKSIAAVPGTYAAALGDVVDGTNGTCATCRAGVGYDQATGWGTPNASQLLQTLTGIATAEAVATTAAPVVPGGSLLGKAGTALSVTLGATAPSGTTTSYALTGAPAGLTVDASGMLKWAAPVAGGYSFTATARTAAGKSASGTYVLTISAPSVVNHAPTLAETTLSEKAGATFAVRLAGKDVDGDALTYTMTGAPSGVSLLPAGILSGATSAKGNWALTVTVHDSHGATATAVIRLVVA